MDELTGEISPPNMELLIGNNLPAGFNSSNNNIHHDQCLEEYDQQQPLLAFHLDSNNALQSSYNFHIMNGSFYDPLAPDHHPDSIGTEAIPLTNSKTSKDHSIAGNKRKRGGCETREAEKPKEVVHVRAKRGQATDSHSLAERQRREKINEKLRSLQDLVPGCYKTMGMAVMLDVIINYVRSLQNQIEFLSMKLSAASMFIDFNSPEMDTLGSMQGTGVVGEWSTPYGGILAPTNLIYPSAPWPPL